MDGLEEEETENHVKKVAAEEDARGLRVGPNPEIVRIQEIVIAEIVAENLAQAPGISDPEPKRRGY